MEVLGSIFRNDCFDSLPFFIGHSNINFMGSGTIPDCQGIALAGNRLTGQIRLLLFGICLLQFFYKLSGRFCIGKNLCPAILVIVIVLCFFIQNGKSPTIRDIGIRVTGFYHRIAAMWHCLLLIQWFLRYRVHSCADEVVKIQRRKLLVNQV